MPWRRKRRGLKYWGVVVLLCVLAAFATIGAVRFFESFYTYVPSHYEPKDLSRGKDLEKDKEPPQSGR